MGSYGVEIDGKQKKMEDAKFKDDWTLLRCQTAAQPPAGAASPELTLGVGS